MFIYNVKVNGSKIFKYFFISVVLFVIVMCFIVGFRIFNGASSSFEKSPCLPQSKITKLSPSNYTNVLKTVHENIDNYVNTTINFTGYVYRVLDLNDDQFILARNMVISSDFQTIVVGFLCEYDNAKDFKDSTWIDLTGTITKGSYHGDMPIVKVNDIKIVDKPNDEFVYPPDDSYIPTSSLF